MKFPKFRNVKGAKTGELKTSDSEEKEESKNTNKVNKKQKDYEFNKKNKAMAKFYMTRNFIEHMFILMEGFITIANSGEEFKVVESNSFSIHKPKYCNN